MIKLVLLSAALFIGATACAQEQESPFEEITPDVRPIGGVEVPGLRVIPGGLSIQPRFRFAQVFDGNSGLENVDYTSSLGGHLDVSRTRNRHQFSLQYDGAATYTTRIGQSSRSFHSLNLSQSVGYRRWTFSIFDAVSYTPESMNADSPGLAGLGDFAAVLSQARLSSSLLPSQGVLTLDTSRVSNSSAGQAQYQFSYRNSLTVGGDLALLRFLERDLQNSNQYTGFASFERKLSPRDSVALKYAYTAVTYANLPLATHVHWTQAIFSRRLSERLIAHLSAGPELVSGARQMTGPRNIGWGADASVQYHRQKYGAGFSGARHTTGGSGVMLGARTDSGNLTLTRTFYRNWVAAVNGGYSRNVGLVPGSGLYNLRTYGAQVSRNIGRSVSTYVSYVGQYQTTHTAVASPFLLDGWRHLFGLGFSWQTRAMVTKQ